MVLVSLGNYDLLDHTVIRWESPCNCFHEDYQTNLGGFVSIASDRVLPMIPYGEAPRESDASSSSAFAKYLIYGLELI